MSAISTYGSRPNTLISSHSHILATSRSRNLTSTQPHVLATSHPHNPLTSHTSPDPSPFSTPSHHSLLLHQYFIPPIPLFAAPGHILQIRTESSHISPTASTLRLIQSTFFSVDTSQNPPLKCGCRRAASPDVNLSAPERVRKAHGAEKRSFGQSSEGGGVHARGSRAGRRMKPLMSGILRYHAFSRLLVTRKGGDISKLSETSTSHQRSLWLVL